MELPTGQLDTLKSGAAALLDACAAIEPPGGTASPDDSDMAMLVQGFDQLLDVIARAAADLQAGGSTGSADITEPGQFAQQLIDSLAARTGQPDTDELRRQLAATHSHDTALMEQAFDVLANKLPEDAGQFFTEGMQQMDALNYPEHVHAVMAKYHRQWNIDRSLH